MKLVIGGCAQGKLNYTLQRIGDHPYILLDGKLPEAEQMALARQKNKTMIIYHFHEWVKKQLQNKENPEEEVRILLGQDSLLWIISDEVGNGIVPMDAFEREWRERTGRILVTLAGQADEVVRVLCGIGQKIK